jgi:hypothetical protein
MRVCFWPRLRPTSSDACGRPNPLPACNAPQGSVELHAAADEPRPGSHGRVHQGLGARAVPRASSTHPRAVGSAARGAGRRWRGARGDLPAQARRATLLCSFFLASRAPACTQPCSGLRHTQTHTHTHMHTCTHACTHTHLTAPLRLLHARTRAGLWRQIWPSCVPPTWPPSVPRARPAWRRARCAWMRPATIWSPCLRCGVLVVVSHVHHAACACAYAGS